MRSARAAACLFVVIAGHLPAQASLAGFVRDSGGRPIPNAQVSIEALSRVATADDNGHYALTDLTPGLRLVRVRRVGYEATSRMVQLSDGQTRESNFVIARLVLLDSVIIAANGVRQRLATEINERRKMGFGYFKDSTTIFRYAGLVSAFQDISPSVTARTDPTRPTKWTIYLPGARQDLKCKANLWIDGKKIVVGNEPDHDELSYLSPNEIAVLEVYPRMSTTPAQYITRGADLAACGTVIIWTKRIVPQDPTVDDFGS